MTEEILQDALVDALHGLPGGMGFSMEMDKNTSSLQKATDLIALYRPAVLVLEDYAGEGSRRSERVENLIRKIRVRAEQRGITVESYSRALIRECFSEFNAWTKHEIAEAIGNPRVSNRCGHQHTETMPTDFCQFFYDCTGCAEVLKPKQGDCCVFCSYGTMPCPPIQEGKEKGEQPTCCQS